MGSLFLLGHLTPDCLKKAMGVRPGFPLRQAEPSTEHSKRVECSVLGLTRFNPLPGIKTKSRMILF
jgi:hypothetical protein